MALPKVVQYIRNVGKSVVYASVENLKEDMPTIKAIAEHGSNKEVYRSIYSGIRDYKTTYKRATNYIKSSKVYEAGDIAVKAAFEDIKTGKWFNTERVNQIDEKLASQLGFGMDDMEGFDEDIDFSDDDSSVDISEGDKLVASSTQVSAMKNAEMVSSTVLSATAAQMRHTEASTNLLYSQQFKLFGDLRSDIINNSAKSIQEQSKTNSIMETVAENSKKFYESTTNMLKDTNGYLKEMVEMQRNLYDAQDKKKSGSEKITIDNLIDSDGVLDLQEYGRLIAKNAKNVLNEKSGGVLDMLNVGNGEGNFLASFASNPLGTILQSGLRGLAPVELKKSLKEFDKSISGVAGTAIARISNLGKDEDANPVLQTLGQIFGVNTSVKSSLDPGKFTKGPVPFDGITRATINNAIPGYLSRIESALTGQPVRVYDPQTGKWTTVKDIKQSYDSMRKGNVRYGTGELAGEIANQIFNNKEYKAASLDEKERIEENFENFMQAIYDNNGDFKLKSFDDYYKYNVAGADLFEMFATAVRNAERSTRLNTATEVMEARSTMNRRMKDLEEKGSIYDILFSGAYDRSEEKRNKNYVEAPKSGIASSLSNYKDALGHDMLYYLKNIYDENFRIRNAVGGFGGSFSMAAGDNSFYGTGREFKVLDGATASHTRIKTEKDKYNASRESARLRYDEQIKKFVDEGGKTYDLNDGPALRRALNNLSDEEKVKVRRQLENEGNFFQNLLYKEHFTEDDINAKREKEGKDALTGKFKERFKKASINEKFQMIVGEANKLTSVPAKWATDMVKTADERIYTLFYGAETGEEDDEGNKIRGMMGLMINRFNMQLNKMTDWLDEKLLDPIKKKLGIESASDILDKLGITDFMNGIKEKVLGTKGEDGKWSGGFLSDFITNTKEAGKQKVSDVKDYVKNGFENVLGPVRDKIKETFKSNTTEKEIDPDELIGGSVDSNVSPISGYTKISSKYKTDSKATIEELQQELSSDFKKYGLPNSDMILWCTSAEDVESIEKDGLLFAINNGKAKRGLTDEVKTGLKNKLKRLKQLFKMQANKGKKVTVSNVAKDATVEALWTSDRALNEAHSGSRIYTKPEIGPLVGPLSHKTDINENTSMLNSMSGVVESLQKALNVKPNSPEGKYIEYLINTQSQTDANFDYHNPGAFLNKMSMGNLVNISQNQNINNKISKIMGEKYNNRDISINEFLRTFNDNKNSVSNNIGGGIFDKVSELLEKIYNHLVRVSNGDAIIVDTVSNNYDVPVIEKRRKNKRRESRTRFDSEEVAQQDSDEPHNDNKIDNKAFGGFFKKAGRSALSEGEIYSKDGLYGKVPKTGVYDVAAGTTIYPTKKDKAIELAKEAKALDEFTSNAEADNAETKRDVNGKHYIKERLKDGKTAWVRREGNKIYILDETGFVDQTIDKAKEAYTEVKSAYKSNLDKAKSKININTTNTDVKKLADDLKRSAPDLTAGGAVGAALGLLAGNPLLGAAVGASMSFVSGSDTAKDMLFGKLAEDSEGNKYRTGGVISKEAQDAFNKYLPSMSSHAMVGGAVGALTPFGIVGGALMGAAIGAARKSDTVMSALFGTSTDPDSGLISQEAREKMKKMLPNVALGALGGVMAGPFGFVGNAVLGSGLGLLSTTNEFKSYILGEEIEANGEKTRVGGLVGTLATEVVDPFVDWGKNFIDETADFLKEKVLNPLADSVPALTHELIHIGSKTIGFIPKLIANMTIEAFKTPIGSTIAAALSPIRKAMGFGAKVAGTVAKGTILAPVTAISAMGKAAKKAQIKRGDASYMMSAAERNAYRDNNNIGRGDKFANIDTTLADSNEKELEAAMDLTRSLSGSKNFFRKNVKGKIMTITKLVSLYFVKSDAKKIIKACKNNQFDLAIELINESTPKDSLQFTPEVRRGLIEKVRSCIKDVDALNKKDNLVGEARENAFKTLESMGFKGVTDANLDMFFKNLEKEQKVRKNAEVEKTPEEKNDDSRKEQTDRIIEAIENATEAINSALNKEVTTDIDISKEVPESVINPKKKSEEKPATEESKQDGQENTEDNKDYVDKLSAIPAGKFDNGKTYKTINMRGVESFNGELNNKTITTREYFDSDSNSIRKFKRTLTGWKEVNSQAKQDADRQENTEYDDKATALAKALKEKISFKDVTNEETGEKKKGIFSKIKDFFGKGLGILGKVALGVTGLAAVGHGYDYAKDTLVPKLKTFWDEKAAPWLDEKLGGRLEAIKKGVKDWFTELPGKIRDAVTGGLDYLSEHKEKIFDWYIDGLKSTAGMVTSAFTWIGSHLPKVLVAVVKNLLWPAISGLGKGLYEGLTHKKTPKLEADKPVGGNVVDTSPMNKIITEANASNNKLGLGYTYSTFSSSGMDTLNVKEEKFDDIKQKYEEAETQEEKDKAVVESYDNAVVGQHTFDDGTVVDVRDTNLMLKDKYGSTLSVDKNGKVFNTNDNLRTTDKERLVKGIGRRLITGNNGIVGKGVRGFGKFTSNVLSKFMPRKAGKVLTKATGESYGIIGKLLDKVPSVQKNLLNGLNVGEVVGGVTGALSQSDMLKGTKLGDVFNNIANSDFVAAGVQSGLDRKALAEAGKNAFEDSRLGKVVNFVKHPLSSVKTGVVDNVSRVKNIANAVLHPVKTVGGVVSGLKNNIGGKINSAKELGSKIVTGAKSWGESAKITFDAAKEFIQDPKKVLSNKMDDIASKAASLKDGVTSIFSKNVDDITEKAATEATKEGVESTAKETAEKASKGMLKTVLSKLNEAIDKGITSLFKNSRVLKYYKEALEGYAKKATKEAVEEAAEASAKGLIRRLKDGIAESLAKVTGTALAKISAGIASGGIFTALFAIADFISGYKNAATILGVTDETYQVSFFEKIIAGLLKYVNGFLVWGLIPEEKLVDIFIDVIAPIFKVDASELKEARAETEQMLARINAEEGADYNVESWNNKDKWTSKAWAGIKKASSSLASGTTSLVKSIFKKEDKENVVYMPGLNTAVNGLGSGRKDKLSMYGTGRVYQKDPMYGGMSFNRSGDSRTQTVADSGCGPAAAVNAVNYAYGKGNSMVSAVGMAKNYKEVDGGTKPEFFDKYFKDNGLQSDRLSGAEIEDNLRKGNPTVLMGKDTKGGYATPYGPNPHYITAKGLDSKGRIIVDDPENPNATAIYDKKRVLGHTSIAIGTKRRYGTGKYGMGPNDIEQNKQIMWSYLIGKGYTEIAASGIMGNIGQECGYNYALKESGGKGPGVGICQWTYKPLKAKFLAAVPNWESNLMGQLDFLWADMNERGEVKSCLPQNLNKATSVEEAVKIFHDSYEKSADKNMNKRNGFGRAIYAQFTGTQPVALPASSTILPGSTMNSDISGVVNNSGTLGEFGSVMSGLFKSAVKATYGDSFGALFGSGSGNKCKYGTGMTYSKVHVTKIWAMHGTGTKNLDVDVPADLVIRHTKTTQPNPNMYTIEGDFGWFYGKSKGYVSVDTAKKYNMIPDGDLEVTQDKPSTVAKAAQSSIIGGIPTTNKTPVYTIDENPAKWPMASIGSGNSVRFSGPYSNEAIKAYTDKVMSYPGSVLIQKVNAYNSEITNAKNGNTVNTSVNADSTGVDNSMGYTDTTTTEATSNSSGGIGSIFDIIKSAFVGAFGFTDSETGEKRNLLSILGLTGGSSGGVSDTSSSGGFTSTSSPAGPAPAGLSKQQSDVYNLMNKIIGKNNYSQTNRNRVGATLNGESQGSGDCSSTVQWALKSAAGVDPGGDTGAQIQSSNGVWVDGAYNFGDNATPNLSNLAVGDLMFYGKSGSSKPRKVSHVEMYYGNATRIGHGSGIGPKISDYTAKANNQQYLGAKRFIPVGDDTTTTMGMGSANIEKGYVSSTFNDPTRDSHNGVDIAAPKGEPVTSNIDGEVIRSEYNDTNGNFVVVRDANGRLHTFQHLLKSDLKVGSRVTSGTIIGQVGSTGKSDGPHVHMSVSEPNGQYVDPISKKPAGKPRPIGGGEGIDYTNLIKAILEILATIADNSKKVDTLIELITGINANGSTPTTTPSTSEVAQSASSMKDKIQKLLNSNGGGLGTMLSSNNASSIVEAMSRIAAE